MRAATKLFTISTLILTLISTYPQLEAQSTGWLGTWSYRNPVTIVNTAGVLLSNFQVHVTLDSSFNFANAKTDGSDLRFTAGDGATLLPFWVESWNAAQGSASLWVQVPSVPTSGTTIYLYYGNSSASSLSNGSSTFDFFDDFQSTNNVSLGYYQLGSPQTEMVRDQAWETDSPHTLSVLAANVGGYTYVGYYGLATGCTGVGLAFSNDLLTWTKYAQNPLFSNGRWPSVLQAGGTFYMLYEKDYCTAPQIVLASSTNGINFTDVKTIVPANYLNHSRNQNPNLFLNPSDGKYYIFWYSGDNTTTWSIMARSATSVTNLDDKSSEATVLSALTILAAPDIMYYNGTYFLSTEVMDNSDQWNVRVYSSTSPTSGFTMLPGNPVLSNNSACMFQHIFGTTLHNYTCKLTNNVWSLEHRSADLSAGRLQFFSPDSSKWTASGGNWAIVSDTKPDGTSGFVLQGSTNAPQIFYSSYSGTDYIADVQGKQIQGRNWGLGARVSDANDYYAFPLYDDLNTSANLWAYRWQNGSATTLGNAAVGQVNPNSWYKLTAKVQGTSLQIYKDDQPQIQTSDASLPSGGVALYGEAGSVANFSNLRVRKYASSDPTTALGTVQVPVVISSLTLNPTSLTGGNTSTGTVALSGPAPSSGAVITLATSNATAVSIPPSVTVPAGSTTATFTAATAGVDRTTSVSITGSYGNSAQTATLTILPPVVSSLALNPTSVTGGSSSVGTVTLNGPAPGDGTVVTLSSNNPAASVPSSVTVPGGATSVTFSVSSSPVASTTAVIITASYGSSVSATLTILPPVLSSLTLNPTTVTGGNSSTGTVTLNGPAPSGGAVVAVSSSNTLAAQTPSTVTISGGGTTATFQVTTLPVVMQTSVGIQGTYNNTTKTANLIITPVVGLP